MRDVYAVVQNLGGHTGETAPTRSKFLTVRYLRLSGVSLANAARHIDASLRPSMTARVYAS